MQTFRAGELERLQVLDLYQFIDEERQTSLAGIAIDAEESVCYRQYKQARAFWYEYMQKSGRRLAATVEGFLHACSREGQTTNPGR